MDKTQVQLVIRDMLFINYAVPPERLRPFVPESLDLDIATGEGGRSVAFVSAVPFRVVDLRTSLLPVPRITFNQVNYRAYVDGGEGPAVYFFDIRVNSRMVTAATSFLRLPVSYEGIEIVTEPTATGAAGAQDSEFNSDIDVKRYSVGSSAAEGLTAELRIAGRQSSIGPKDEAIAPEFITERPIGYVSSATGMFRMTVEHPKLDSRLAGVESCRAPLLESLSVLNMDESMHPHSVLYVREAVMNTNPPAPWSR